LLPTSCRSSVPSAWCEPVVSSLTLVLDSKPHSVALMSHDGRTRFGNGAQSAGGHMRRPQPRPSPQSQENLEKLIMGDQAH
jgi:hypothetical protein